MVKEILGIENASEDAVIDACLTAARKEILAWRYPSGSAPKGVPAEYEMTQVFAVIAGYSQRGAENQLSHVENGITRTFAHSDMVDYIRANVIPMCGVPG